MKLQNEIYQNLASIKEVNVQLTDKIALKLHLDSIFPQWEI